MRVTTVTSDSYHSSKIFVWSRKTLVPGIVYLFYRSENSDQWFLSFIKKFRKIEAMTGSLNCQLSQWKWQSYIKLLYLYEQKPEWILPCIQNIHKNRNLDLTDIFLFWELPPSLSNSCHSFKISARSGRCWFLELFTYLSDSKQLPPECENFSALFNWKQRWWKPRKYSSIPTFLKQSLSYAWMFTSVSRLLICKS